VSKLLLILTFFLCPLHLFALWLNYQYFLFCCYFCRLLYFSYATWCLLCDGKLIPKFEKTCLIGMWIGDLIYNCITTYILSQTCKCLSVKNFCRNNKRHSRQKTSSNKQNIWPMRTRFQKLNAMQVRYSDFLEIFLFALVNSIYMK